MKNLKLPIIFCYLFLLNSCSSDLINSNDKEFEKTIVGIGEVVENEITVHDFTKFTNSVFTKVTIKFDNQTKLSVRGQQNILDQIKYGKETDRLKVELKQDVNISTSEELSAEITIKSLDEINEIGAGIYEIGESKCSNFNINIVGGALVYGLDYTSQNCYVNITGAAVCYVQTEKMLNVNIVGSGAVYYKGEPSVKSSIVGTGFVKRYNK